MFFTRQPSSYLALCKVLFRKRKSWLPSVATLSSAYLTKDSRKGIGGSTIDRINNDQKKNKRNVESNIYRRAADQWRVTRLVSCWLKAILKSTKIVHSLTELFHGLQSFPLMGTLQLHGTPPRYWVHCNCGVPNQSKIIQNLWPQSNKITYDFNSPQIQKPIIPRQQLLT